MDGKEFKEFKKEEIIAEEAYQNFQEKSTEQELIQRKIASSDEFSEDFTCSVCFHIAVQPTSLTCGHTFCRICLAKWYLATKWKECPLCSQEYQGCPMINIDIKNLIAKLYPKELKEREQTLESSLEDKTALSIFEKALADKTLTGRRDGRAFCLGIIFTLFAFTIVYLLWFWQFSERNLFVNEPVQFWKPQDVKAWLKDISWATEYANSGMENNVDGNTLLNLDEESLLQLFNVSEPVHQKAFLSAVAMLKEEGIKLPSTLWEYKELFPGRCLFLVYGLHKFPRITILYLWLYFYDDMFLPIVKSATESAGRVNNISNSQTVSDRFSTSQWVNFVLSALMLPQWLVILIAYRMLTHSSFTLLAIIINAVLVQTLEILSIISFIRNNLERRDLIRICVHYGRQMLFAFTFMVFWPVIPAFVCDVVFYSALYVRPLYMGRSVHIKLRRFNM